MSISVHKFSVKSTLVHQKSLSVRVNFET